MSFCCVSWRFVKGYQGQEVIFRLSITVLYFGTIQSRLPTMKGKLFSFRSLFVPRTMVSTVVWCCNVRSHASALHWRRPRRFRFASSLRIYHSNVSQHVFQPRRLVFEGWNFAKESEFTAQCIWRSVEVNSWIQTILWDNHCGGVVLWNRYGLIHVLEIFMPGQSRLFRFAFVFARKWEAMFGRTPEVL